MFPIVSFFDISLNDLGLPVISPCRFFLLDKMVYLSLDTSSGKSENFSVFIYYFGRLNGILIDQLSVFDIRFIDSDVDVLHLLSKLGHFVESLAKNQADFLYSFVAT